MGPIKNKYFIEQLLQVCNKNYLTIQNTILYFLEHYFFAFKSSPLSVIMSKIAFRQNSNWTVFVAGVNGP